MFSALRVTSDGRCLQDVMVAPTDGGLAMFSHTQQRLDPSTRELRLQAGRRLRGWREKRGLSQRELCREVGARYYTIISALESGRGRIPLDQYLVWARALGIEPREFVREIMCYYDPETYNTLFCGPGRRLVGVSPQAVGDQTQC